MRPHLPQLLFSRSFLLTMLFGLRLRLTLQLHLEHVLADAADGILRSEEPGQDLHN